MTAAISDLVSSLPFSSLLDDESLSRLRGLAKTRAISKGEVLSQQYASAKEFGFLLEGGIQFFQQIEQLEEKLLVGETKTPWTPVGWAGFRPPHRNKTTCLAERDCQLLYWKRKKLQRLFDEDPQLACHFFCFVIEQLQVLLAATRSLAVAGVPEGSGKFEDRAETSFELEANFDAVAFLKAAPFFETFSDNHIKALAKIAQLREIGPDQTVQIQGDTVTSFNLLVTGKVLNLLETQGRSHALDLIHQKGHVVGWPGANQSTLQADVTIRAIEKTKLLSFDRTELVQLYQRMPELGRDIMARLIWIISNRLRVARTRYVSHRFKQEFVSVANLLDVNAPQLSVHSRLHKLPHLLSHAVTTGDGFELLDDIAKTGNSLEKGLARVIANSTLGTRQEHLFYRGLSKAYHTVVTSPTEMSRREVRNACARVFVDDVLPHVDFEMVGWENLPAESGNIFIYNHLTNHDQYTLPNKFALTLDSHFISSMISLRKYGDSGIRVVRIGFAKEYGHEDYYDALGHIGVISNESEPIEENREQRKARLKRFFDQATNHLNEGTNLILSPEGTTSITPLSPGPFKSGVFHVAASAKNDPWIIPIAIANFELRMNNNKLGVVIKKPFKLSERVNDVSNKSEMSAFLEGFQKEYRGYVQEAIALTES
jgi:CRP-like cAMP-binding protein